MNYWWVLEIKHTPCFRLRTSHFSMIRQSVKLVQHSWVCVKCECKSIRSEWSSAIMFCCLNLIIKKKSLSVNVFSTKVLIGDTIFTSPNGDGTAILRGHPSHAKVSPLAVQRKYLHFSVILRPWVMVRPRESNPRPPALQSNTLPTELILLHA